MKLQRKFVFLSVIPLMVGALSATIDFGNESSGFESSTGTLAFDTGIVLGACTVKSTGSSGSITSAATACSGVTVHRTSGSELALKKMVTDGTLTLGTSITLGNNQMLLVEGGEVVEQVTAQGDYDGSTPSIVRGSGHFSSDINVDGHAQLDIDWDGALDTNICLRAAIDNSAYLSLQNDLVFAPGYCVTTTDVESANNEVLGNGYKIFIGGTSDAATHIAHTQEWASVGANLCGPVTLDVGISFYLGGSASLNGQGNAWTFGDDTATLAMLGDNCLITNVVFEGYSDSSITSSGDSVRFANVRFNETAGRSVTFDGSITSSTCLMSSSVSFASGARLTLNHDYASTESWSMSGLFMLDGQGHVFDATSTGARFTFGASASLRLSNVTLANVASASINTSANTTPYVYMSNVTWLDADANAVRIIGTTQGPTQGAARARLIQNANAGNLFGNITWTDGVNMELLNDIELDGTWTFAEDSIIEGHGKKITVGGGVLSVAAGKTLYLRNVVLGQFVSGTIPSTSGTISLSDVTIILPNANVSWGTPISVDGPCMVVTGSHSLTAPSGSAINDRVTLLYDTLTSPDAGNHIVGFNEGSGRIACMSVGAPVTLTISADYDVNDDIILQAADDGTPGRSIVFTGDAAYWFNGHGRTVHCPYSNSTLDNDVVISVTGSVEPLIETLVKTKNVTFDGLKPTHLSVDEGKSILFGHNTVVNLNQDWTGDDALANTLTFGTSTGATNEVSYLDLRGHTLDLASGSAGIALQGASGCKLYIMNGRITNLSGTKITATSNSRIIYENVDISLSADYTSHDANTTFQGRCKVSGLPGSTFINPSLQQLLIASNSVLTFTDGVVYSHHNDAVVNNFVFTDKSSCLELIGAVFRRSDPATSEDVLPLSGGTIIIDHKVYFQPGLEGIIVGDTDTPSGTALVIRPGANIVVTSGGDASSGTLQLAV